MKYLYQKPIGISGKYPVTQTAKGGAEDQCIFDYYIYFDYILTIDKHNSKTAFTQKEMTTIKNEI